MSIRKRTWKTATGEAKSAWVVDYVDQNRKRHLRTFNKKKQADAFAPTASVEVREGTHVSDNESVTVVEAGRQWIKTAVKNGLERTTVDQYRQHLDIHIAPYLGGVKLSRLTKSMVREFENKLRDGTPAPGQSKAEPRTPALTKKILSSLGSILADAGEDDKVARNVVRDLRSRRHRGKARRAERRQKGKLQVGLDIPTTGEIKAMVAHLPDRWRPLLLTAIFSGLRASEIRGLRWHDVDLSKAELHVRQRADRYNVIGKPKSESGERTVPLPPVVVNALREWKIACPKGRADLVFPNGAGNIESHANIINRALIPVQMAAGVCSVVRDKDRKVVCDKDGEPVRIAKYTGLHALRHFYASWCINRTVDGGLGLPLKVVQERLGHSSIMMTSDVYGHLFPRGDDGSELAEAERKLLG